MPGVPKQTFSSKKARVNLTNRWCAQKAIVCQPVQACITHLPSCNGIAGSLLLAALPVVRTPHEYDPGTKVYGLRRPLIKTVTYQRMTPAASRQIGEVTERQCRVENMLAHGITARVRVERYERL